MAAALVILFFGGIFLAIFMIITVVGVSMFIAPFAGGALASVMVCETVPGAKGLVPGHTFLNYLVVLFIVETIIIILLHIPSVSRAVNVLTTSFFVCVVGFPILDHLHPDSIGFCILMSVLYAAGAAVVLWNSINEWDNDDCDGNLILRLIACAIYGLAGIVLSFPLIGGIWMKFYEGGTIYSFVAFCVMIGVAVTFGIIGWMQDEF